MRSILVLLAALTVGFGVGATTSIDRAPAFTDDSRNGYYFSEEPLGCHPVTDVGETSEPQRRRVELFSAYT